MSKTVGAVGLGGLGWWLELAGFEPVSGVDEVCARLADSKFPVVCADLGAVKALASVRSKPIFLMLVSDDEHRFNLDGVNAKVVWVSPSSHISEVFSTFGLPDNRIPTVAKSAALSSCIDSSDDDDDLWGDDDDDDDLAGLASQGVAEPSFAPYDQPHQAVPDVTPPHQAPARVSVADVLANLNEPTPATPTTPTSPPTPAIPLTSASPFSPASPATPATPSTPATPPTPSTPATPLTPATNNGDLFLPGRFDVPNVLLVWAPMGGVGKTSLTQAIAVWAARSGISTILVDGNAGQADQQLMLGIGGANVATIADWSRGADEVFTAAGAINRLRGDEALPSNFAFIAGAPERPVSSDIFLRAVNYSASKAELVVVDTQVVDTKVASSDDSMISEFMLPLWRGGAWGLGLMEPSAKGASNLYRWMRRLADVYKLDMSRQMVAVNKMPYSLSVDANQLKQAFGGLGSFVGAAYQNDELFAAMSFGGLGADDEGLAGIASRVVDRIRGS